MVGAGENEENIITLSVEWFKYIYNVSVDGIVQRQEKDKKLLCNGHHIHMFIDVFYINFS